jgi:hypothetical protein
MSNPHAAVKKTPISVHKAAAAVQTLQAVVAAGAASGAVQGSPVAKQALADLQAAVAPLGTAVSNKVDILSQLNAARKGVTTQFTSVEALLRNYETTVNTLAAGNAQIITAAGLLARGVKTPAAALSPIVDDFRSALGKAVKTAVLRWDKGGGRDQLRDPGQLDAGHRADGPVDGAPARQQTPPGRDGAHAGRAVPGAGRGARQRRHAGAVVRIHPRHRPVRGAPLHGPGARARPDHAGARKARANPTWSRRGKGARRSRRRPPAPTARG